MSEPTQKELAMQISAVVSDQVNKPLSQEAIDTLMQSIDKALVEVCGFPASRFEAVRGDDPTVAVISIGGPYELMKPLLDQMGQTERGIHCRELIWSSESAGRS